MIEDDEQAVVLRVVLYILGAVAVLFVTYLAMRARRGLSIAKHLHLFGAAYDDAYAQTGDKVSALDSAFHVFRTCPGLRNLTADEVEAAIVVLCLAPDPRWVVEKIVLKLDSRHLARAFRDLDFLTNIVDVGMRRG